MSAVSVVADALLVALRAVDGLRASQDHGGEVNPPEAVIGPPQLVWEGFCAGPSTATFRISLVVANTDRAMEVLWDLLPTVTAAIDTVPDAVVTRADPGSFTSGGSALPAYDITVECSL